jgi:carbon storage regulator
MLIVTRKPGEAVVINDNIEVVVVSIEGGQIRLGISAPSSVRIHRKELYERIQAANREAATHKQSIPQIKVPEKKTES